MTIATLRKTIRDISQGITEELSRKWTDDQFEQAIKDALKDVDLNDYRDELIGKLCRAEVAERAKIQPFVLDSEGHVQPSLFSEEEADRGIIRLGDGQRVLMSKAAASDWIAHASEQAKAAHRAQEATLRTHSFLESPVGVLLMENPGMTTRAAMKQLGYW